MAVTTTNFSYALKTLWKQKRVENLGYKNRPFFAMVPKHTDFKGANKVIALRYAQTPGRSATFATALANKGNHSGAKFTLTRVKDYALASLENEVVEASKGDEAALLSAMDAEMESAVDALTKSLAIKLYRASSAAIGRCSNDPVDAGGPITLTNPQDIVNFEVGQKIIAADAESGGTLRAGTGTVSAVDRDAGTVTYTGTITGITTSDYIFTEGDRGAALSGLADWLPATAPGSTAFFGVDRSVDTTRLGGVRKDISSLPIQEGLLSVANRLFREGAAPDHAFVNPDQFTNLEHVLGAKVQFTDLKKGEVGFKGIVINGNAGPITVLADPFCPVNLGYMLQMDTWGLHSLGGAPHIIDADGNKMLREASADAYECRWAFYGNLACSAPGWNAVMTMPSVA